MNVDPDPAVWERRALRRERAEAALGEAHERCAWAIYTESGLMAARTYIRESGGNVGQNPYVGGSDNEFVPEASESPAC